MEWSYFQELEEGCYARDGMSGVVVHALADMAHALEAASAGAHGGSEAEAGTGTGVVARTDAGSRDVRAGVGAVCAGAVGSGPADIVARRESRDGSLPELRLSARMLLLGLYH